MPNNNRTSLQIALSVVSGRVGQGDLTDSERTLIADYIFYDGTTPLPGEDYLFIAEKIVYENILKGLAANLSVQILSREIDTVYSIQANERFG